MNLPRGKNKHGSANRVYLREFPRFVLQERLSGTVGDPPWSRTQALRKSGN